jgi:hypothetical protein
VVRYRLSGWPPTLGSATGIVASCHTFPLSHRLAFHVKTTERSAGSSSYEGGSRSRGPYVGLAASLGGISLFFLVRPALSGGPYYSPRVTTGYAYWFLTAAAFVPYVLAIRAYRRGGWPPVPLLFLVAAILYLALIPAPAQQSQDVYQSLLYGKMAVHGHDPYVIYAATIEDPWRSWTLWSNTLSVYGPVWTMLNAVVVKASGENLTTAFLLMKALGAILALFSGSALAHAARDSSDGLSGNATNKAGFAVLLFLYNPLILFSVGVGAHPDIAVAAAFAGAVLLERRRHGVLTTLLLAAGALVKAYAGLVLVAWLICVARRRGLRVTIGHAVAAAGAGVLCYVPFWRGISTFSGIASIGKAASASLTGTIMRLVSGHPMDAIAAGSAPLSSVIRAVAGILLLVAVIGVGRSPRSREEPWRAGALLFAAYILLTPWYLPWHLTGLVFLVVLVSDGPLTWSTIAFSGSSLFVGGGLIGQMLIRYAFPVWLATRLSRRHSDHGQESRQGRVEKDI